MTHRLPILADFLFLHNLLSEKSIEHQSFESISTHITKKFNRNDFLSVGTLLSLLIKNNDLPETTNRLVAYYVLFDMFRSESETEQLSYRESPFQYFLHTIVKGKDSIFITKVERNFIVQLLTSGTKDLAKQTPHHIKQTDQLTVPMVELNSNFCALKEMELPASTKCNIMNIIPAPVPSVSDSAIRELMEGLFRRDTPLKSVFGPQFMTIAPPLLPCNDELVWFDLTNPICHKPVFDMNFDEEHHGGESSSEPEVPGVKKLIENAFKQALSLQDQKTFESELDQDPELVNHIGMTPQKLPELVENNPMIAIKILLLLMESSDITEYLSELVNMEMSLHSMEVVNRLTSSVDLPSEFIHLYISNCIATCENIQDKYMQSRLIRLACVFLQSLIRNKKICNLKDLFIEVESFCVDHSKIREAAALYRMIKNQITAEKE